MKKRSHSVVKQASILALAGILVRIIGILYRSPLTAMIKDEGIGYYSQAYNIYALILLISSYSIPSAISKLISEKIAIHQYRNAKKILKCIFIYICAIAGGAAIVTFILAPFIVPYKESILALKILCPTIFLSGLLGVFRGYFQAHQTMLYTSVSQILEQIGNAIVSVLAAYLFIQPYLLTKGSQLASSGAAGAALGTGAGVLIGLIYICYMYLKKKNQLLQEVEPDDFEDTYKDIFKMILNIVTPIIIATCIYNLVSTIDMYLYTFVMELRGVSSKMASTYYGVYSGKYIVLQNVPVALASAMSTASIPAISSSYAIKDIKKTKELIQSGINTTMMMLIPATVGMAVLAYPIMSILFPQKETIQIATMLLTVGSPAITFYGLSTLTNGILQAIGEVNIPLKNAVYALITHVIIVLIFLTFTSFNLYALVLGNCTYALQVCYLNQQALKRKLRYKQEIKRTYLLPIVASILMGVAVWGVYQLLFIVTHRVFLPLMISVVVGIVVYFAIIIFFYWEHPSQLYSLPYMRTIFSKLKKRIK